MTKITPSLSWAAFLLLTLVPLGACSSKNACTFPDSWQVPSSVPMTVDEVIDPEVVLWDGALVGPHAVDGLPPGVAMEQPTGNALVGTPTATGTFTVTITSKGDDGYDCADTSRTFEIVVADKSAECASDSDCEADGGTAICNERKHCVPTGG
ncbi:MAG: hypothetical protein ACRELY_16430 [Polyangiaceae bacterium]